MQAKTITGYPIVQPRQKGFSLIELITVVVILGIISSISVSFVVKTTQSYQQTQARSKLTMHARQAMERMSRQLRAALPYSVRVTNSNQCIEFMPVASGGFYLNAVSDTKNNAPAQSVINVAPHQIDFGSAVYMTIGAMSSNEIYGGANQSIATVSSRSQTSVSLSSAKTWLRNSVNKRFYLLSSPQAFCVVSNQLRIYENQSLIATSVNTASASSLLADNVSATTPFSLTMASDNRNTVIQFQLTFSESGQSLDFGQQVMIRNVP
jgi:MSHA biogenesis protein MshO